MASDVDEWFKEYNNPMAEVVQAVRRLILDSDSRIDECIKWKSPTFTFNGNIASFNPRSKKHASLMFHTGAHIPGTHPALEGGGDTARYMTFVDLDEVDAKAHDLKTVLAAWCDWKE
ncbi:MAG: DUF1801 domain-containing protein [Acidimicrobiales bacterium]